VRAITSALAKEKNLACRKDLMRALGSAGAADDKARKALLKFVASEKDPTVRLNAVVALGWLAPGADVNKVLGELLASAQPDDRRAAVVAWVAVVEKALAADADPNFKTAAEAALKVLKGENLATLRAPLRSICDDGLEREKFFGNGQMQIPGMGGAGGAPGGGGGGAGGGTGGGSGGGTGG
jgi:uncharacterized membrane protein YgcG